MSRDVFSLHASHTNQNVPNKVANRCTFDFPFLISMFSAFIDICTTRCRHQNICCFAGWIFSTKHFTSAPFLICFAWVAEYFGGLLTYEHHRNTNSFFSLFFIVEVFLADFSLSREIGVHFPSFLFIQSNTKLKYRPHLSTACADVAVVYTERLQL